MVSVYDGVGNLVDMPVNAQGEGNDETVMHTGPGKYYLDITSANIDWTISISEQ